MTQVINALPVWEKSQNEYLYDAFEYKEFIKNQNLKEQILKAIFSNKKRENKELIDIQATIHVERDSQKPMLIGKQGIKIKEIGTKARAQIENYLELLYIHYLLILYFHLHLFLFVLLNNIDL